MNNCSTLSRKKKLRRKKGQTLVEYALILAFVSVLAIGMLQAVGTTTSDAYGAVDSKLDYAESGGNPGSAPVGGVPDDSSPVGAVPDAVGSPSAL